MKCIYCLEEKEPQEFTKEHVLSQAFGKFEQNLTLTEEVCGDCNSKVFGETFDRVLSRDTFEGTTLRFEHSIKPVHKFKSQGKRSELIYKIKEEGEYKGAYFFRAYSEESQAILNYLCPQIGFLRKTGEYEWHLLDNIPEKTSINLDEYDNTNPHVFKMVECDPTEALEALRQKGFDVQQGEEFSVADDLDVEIMGEVTRNIDDNIFRPVAKMSFNYLTKWKGRDFVLDSTFDPIRRYIR